MAIKRKKKGGGVSLRTSKPSDLFGSLTNERLIMAGLIAIVAGVFAADYFSPARQAYRGQQRKALSERAEAELGNDRYRRKCTMLVRAPKEGEYEHQIVTLSASIRPADIVSGASLFPGTIVCDDKFNTGRISENGFVGDQARASDEDLVNQRVADFIGWNVRKRRSAVGVVCSSQDCLENQNQGE